MATRCQFTHWLSCQKRYCQNSLNIILSGVNPLPPGNLMSGLASDHVSRMSVYGKCFLACKHCSVRCANVGGDDIKACQNIHKHFKKKCGQLVWWNLFVACYCSRVSAAEVGHVHSEQAVPSAVNPEQRALQGGRVPG